MSGTESSSVTWVVGSGGLLGQAVTKHLRHAHPARGVVDRTVLTSRIPWSDVRSGRTVLREFLHEVLDRSMAGGAPWRIAWCAGAGVVGTSAQALRDAV